MPDTLRGPARNWSEDIGHEGGQYLCRCSACGETFVGHKRRAVCKACSEAGSSTTGDAVNDAAFTVGLLPATPERRAAGRLLAACEKAERLAEVAERVGRLGECGNDGGHAAAAVELFDLLAEFRAAIRAARGEATADGDVEG